MKTLVAKIKEKKELANLDNDYVASYVEKLLDAKTKDKMNSLTEKQFFKSKEWKGLQSAVRKQLRETYGVFQEKRELPEELTDFEIRKVLDTHQSTKERLPYYTKLYQDLFTITGEPKKIMDVGCGLNPMSHPFMGCNPHYVCSDISSADMEFLNEFFTRMKISGKAHAIDALSQKQIELAAAEKPDVVFCFKLFNTLETIKRHSTKKLFAALAEHTNWIIVSFATVSLGGGKLIHQSKFSWFENYLKKNGWTAEIVEIPNEKFYVVKT